MSDAADIVIGAGMGEGVTRLEEDDEDDNDDDAGG